MIIDSFGGPDKIKLAEVAINPPDDHEIQIRILYAAVNPVDYKIREGLLKDRMPYTFPIILGWDASGKVSSVGKKVKNFRLGDEVYAYCRKSIIHDGTYAEFINVDADHVAFKPKTLNFAEAASIPLAGLTAWQALFDCAKIKKGETVLIHAGAGGVGSLAIQFARVIDTKIYSTASVSNFSYVKGLGAHEVIDYKNEDFVEKIRNLHPDGIDVVFDTVGGSTTTESLEVVKPGGRIVSLLETINPEIADKYKVEATYLFVSPNGQELKQIASLVDTGKVQAPRIEEMQLNDAGEAQEKLKKGIGGGKIVLKIP